MRSALSIIVVASLVALPIENARSQGYPGKPVRIIVPYAPGANADLIARLVAQRLIPTWGQQVLLDNRPGGATNIGSANQMAGEQLKMIAKIDIVHVPYKGSAPAITDAVGGHVEMLFAGISSLVTHFRSGRLRPLATGSTKRLPMIADVPTFIEAGFPEMTTSVWFGLMAPAATPPDILARINTDVHAILSSQEARERLIADGQEPGGGSPEELDKFIRNEIAKYAKVIKAAGIKPE